MIRLFDYQRGLPEIQPEISEALERVLNSNQLVLGPETSGFEQEFAKWLGVEHCVAVTSGTVAIYLALKAVDVNSGKEVITVSNTCPPTIAAIRMTGATPVFVDVDKSTLMMDPNLVAEAITNRTACILPVHLWGNSVNLGALKDLACEFELAIVEDCAQATGTRFSGRHVGTTGTMGCFSFYPTKNLGAFGDSGAVVTSDPDLAKRLRMLRMYGYDSSPISIIDGVNARINELQAAFLRVRLSRLDQDLERRRSNANRYLSVLRNDQVPQKEAEVKHSYHQFVIRTSSRDSVTEQLDQSGIQWAIHYENPTHLMPAFKQFHRELPITELAAGEILSIPVHEHLADPEVSKIAELLGKL